LARFDGNPWTAPSFWTAGDLEMKLFAFQRYYNGHRAHAGLEGSPPESSPDEGGARSSIHSYRWQPHCRGLYHTPMDGGVKCVRDACGRHLRSRDVSTN